jgi:DNA-binding response OmpR family regulator
MLDFEALYKQTKDLNILFVEDYIPLREIIVEILEDFFNIVVETNNGEEGLKAYIDFKKTHQKYFDIVITDIKMPKLNGISLTKSIQEIHGDQIIVVLSAHQETEYLMELINLGIAQFIPKPVEHEKLLEVISQVCKKIKLQKPKNIETDTIILDTNLIWNKKLLTLTHNSRQIELTKNELLVMQLLVSRLEYVCSVDTITDYFFNEGIDTSNESIRNMMSRLRKKLTENVITNIYGLGYKLSRQN